MHSSEQLQQKRQQTIANSLTHLTGFCIDVSFGEELLNNSHVVWSFHSCKCGQHDGCVTGFVLLIHVAHLCALVSQKQGEQKIQRRRSYFSYSLVVFVNDLTFKVGVNSDTSIVSQSAPEFALQQRCKHISDLLSVQIPVVSLLLCN